MAQFWKPGSSAGTGIERSGQAGDVLLVNNRHKHLSLSQQRQILPIYRHRTTILYALEKFSTVIVAAETGSGKSTQIPLYLLESGWASNGKGIVCTQPRKMAALTVAHRVAQERGCEVGSTVGYTVRFDSKFSDQTKIKYCTDGVLVRETLSDPLLTAYNVVIVDEAHERSLHSDVLLGILKKIRRKRPELRIIITSATMNAQGMKDFFETNIMAANPDPTQDTACIVSIQGRMHPVDICYLQEPCINYLQSAVDTVLAIHKNEDTGDVLVFLPGAEDIDQAVEMLHEYYEGSDLIICALYSSLPAAVQMSVFDPTAPGKRKVVIATNIAETSVTIEGVRFVVDACFVKLNYFEVDSGVEFLITCPTSKASASQRAGRAGRTQPGKCFRLLTEADFDRLLPAFTPPEMQRTDISAAVLQLKALGVDNVLRFDFLSPPPSQAMIYALELLCSLGAIDPVSGRLTAAVGEKLAEMPVEPRLAKCLLSSFDFGCSEEMLAVAAMCSVETPFVPLRHRSSQETKQRHWECIGAFASLDGDHVTWLKVYKAFVDNGRDPAWCDSMCLQHRILSRAYEVHNHLTRMLKAFKPPDAVFSSCGEDTAALRKCIVSGYFSNAAQLRSDGKYHTIRGDVSITPHYTSVLARFGTQPEWIVFNEMVHTKSAQIRDVCKIDPNWLVELAEHYFRLEKRS